MTSSFADCSVETLDIFDEKTLRMSVDRGDKAGKSSQDKPVGA